MNIRMISGPFCALSLAVLAVLSPIQASELDRAKILADDSSAARSWISGTLKIDLAMTDPAPYRAFTLSAPDRLVVDVQGADLAGLGQADLDARGIAAWRFGLFQPGWSRLVFDLAEPLVLERADLETDGDTTLKIRLSAANREDFDAASGAPSGLDWQANPTPDLYRAPGGKLRVAIDPGHGGIDPGAVREGVAEKDLALAFARELASQIAEDAQFAVYMTREGDHFVPLSQRVEQARDAGADLFLSIHANTVTRGNASGATVYTLSDTASDKASAALAELENRADLTAGLSVSTELDEIARVLIDMAMVETQVRSKSLADTLVESLQDPIGVLKTDPHRSAGFKVLSAPDMASVLLEIGFLSNETDRANMQQPEWRSKASAAVLTALKKWAESDRTRSQLVLK